MLEEEFLFFVFATVALDELVLQEFIVLVLIHSPPQTKNKEDAMAG